jgi:hypothetical protein
MCRLVIYFLLISFNLPAQTSVFQGQVDYKHLFHFKEAGVDSMKALKAFGTSSQYITRSGFYKWVFYDGEEYYSSIDGKTYNRYADNDTLFLTKGSEGDTLLRYEIYPNADTICGYICDRIKVTIRNRYRDDYILTRIISYAKDLPVNPEDFRLFESYCHNEVYKITRSIPLRIEIDTNYWPFIMCYYAIKVDHRPVTEKEVRMPADRIKKEN